MVALYLIEFLPLALITIALVWAVQQMIARKVAGADAKFYARASITLTMKSGRLWPNKQSGFCKTV